MCRAKQKKPPKTIKTVPTMLLPSVIFLKVSKVNETAFFFNIQTILTLQWD